MSSEIWGLLVKARLAAAALKVRKGESKQCRKKKKKKKKKNVDAEERHLKGLAAGGIFDTAPKALGEGKGGAYVL